jgi:hypothetical protein
MPAQVARHACAAVGAVQAVRYDKQNSTRSIAARPCKERKDGAPTVPEREGRARKTGHPPRGTADKTVEGPQ